MKGIYVGDETLVEYCRREHVDYKCMYARLARGWSLADALQGKRSRQSQFNDVGDWHQSARALGFATQDDESIKLAIYATYQKTGSSRKTAELFGRGAQTIRTHLHKMGATVQTPGGHNGRD